MLSVQVFQVFVVLCLSIIVCSVYGQNEISDCGGSATQITSSNSIYHFVLTCDRARTQPEAQSMCEYQFSSDLATINNRENNTAAQTLREEACTNCKNYDAWIGATDVETEGTFRWPNGDLVTTSFWFRNEPNDFGEGQDCVIMGRGDTSRWDDQACVREPHYGFFCDVATITTTTFTTTTTTAAPTTQEPTTRAPTTESPTTQQPTTRSPTPRPSVSPFETPTTRNPTPRPSLSPFESPTTRSPTPRPTLSPVNQSPTTPTWNTGSWWGRRFGNN